jgi:hypothetical protein
MSSKSLQILGAAAALLCAATFTAFASPDGTVTREIPVTSDIQRYFAAHGVDQTLDNMVLAALRNDLDPYADPATLSMVLGSYTFTLSSDQRSLITTGANSPAPTQGNG